MFSLFDFRSGGPILPLDVQSGSWSVAVGRPGTVQCKVLTGSVEMQLTDLWSSGTPLKSALAYELGDRVIEAGPIWTDDYDRDAGTLDLIASGSSSVLAQRFILPGIAETLPTPQFYIPDPTNPGGTLPNPLLDTRIHGVDYGTIMKRLVQQTLARTGGDLPIVFQPDRPGIRDFTFTGIEFPRLLAELDALAAREGGVEFRFSPRRVGERIEWLLETATDTARFLMSPQRQSWRLVGADEGSTDESHIRKVKVNRSAGSMASLAWATAGRTGDTPLLSRRTNAGLIEAGYPLTEILDASHSSVRIQATLDDHTGRALTLGSAPTETWSFELAADVPPLLGDWWLGDLVELNVIEDDYIPAGRYEMRILAISGKHEDRWVTVTCSPGKRIE